MADQVIYKGTSGPSITDTIKVAGSPIDLTGATIRFQARDPRSNVLVLDVAGAQIVILNQTTNKGQVRYDPNATDTAVAFEVPPLVAWWHVTISGVVQDTPESFNLFIRDHGQARSADLCTITDVRKALRITDDHSRDDQIQSFISRASPMIMRWCDREFAPATASATRTFPIDITGGDLVVELAPWDLRSAATVTLNPDLSNPITLTTTQYQLEPTNVPDGVYKRVRLSPFIGGLISTTALTFGYSKLAIQGAWGFATVPDDVVQAAAIIVASWLDVAQGQYQSADVFGDLPRMTLPNADARSAWSTLAAYKRMVP